MPSDEAFPKAGPLGSLLSSEAAGVAKRPARRPDPPPAEIPALRVEEGRPQPAASSSSAQSTPLQSREGGARPHSRASRSFSTSSLGSAASSFYGGPSTRGSLRGPSGPLGASQRGSLLERRDSTSSTLTTQTRARSVKSLEVPRRRRGTAVKDATDPQLALLELDNSVRDEPTVPQHWRNRSLLRAKVGDFAGALEDIEVLRRLGAMGEGDWIHSADMRLRRGDYEGVIQDCAEAMSFSSFRSKSWLMRGRAKLMLRDFDGANKDLSEGLRLDPVEARDWTHRAHARLRLGDVGGAYYDCNEAVRLDPRDFMAWFFRAEARIDRKDHAGAISDCDKCLRLNGRCAAALSHRSTAKLHLEDWHGVVADTTAALILDPKIATAYGNRGEARHALGDLSGAIADSEEAARLNPAYPRALHCSGRARLNKGDYEGALERAGHAVGHEPDYQEAHDVLRVAKDSQRVVGCWHVPLVDELRGPRALLDSSGSPKALPGL